MISKILKTLLGLFITGIVLVGVFVHVIAHYHFANNEKDEIGDAHLKISSKLQSNIINLGFDVMDTLQDFWPTSHFPSIKQPQWTINAAKAGSQLAQYELAEYYAGNYALGWKMNDIKQDPRKSFYWLQQAIKQGYTTVEPSGFHNGHLLPIIVEYNAIGYGTPINTKKAFDYIRAGIKLDWSKDKISHYYASAAAIYDGVPN